MTLITQENGSFPHVTPVKTSQSHIPVGILKQIIRIEEIKIKRNKKPNRNSKAPFFKISSISSFDGGSAALGTDCEAPFGTQEIAAIIVVYFLPTLTEPIIKYGI